MQQLKNFLKNANSALRCKWELFKFKRRRAARARKRIPIRWLTHWRLVSDELKLMYEIEPKKFNEKFLEKNLQTYEAIKQSNFKLALLQFSIIIFLILSTFEIDLPLTAFGFKLTTTPGLNELLIVLVSVITASTIGKSISIITLLSTIRTLVPIIYKNEFTYFYMLNSNVDDMPAYFRPSLSPHIVWAKITSFASSFMVLFLVAKTLIVLGASIVWRYFVYIEIWTNPTISAQLAKSTVSISIILDVASLVVVMIYVIPMPHRDYLVNQTMELAEQMGLEAKNQALQDIYGEDLDDEADMIVKGYINKS